MNKIKFKDAYSIGEDEIMIKDLPTLTINFKGKTVIAMTEGAFEQWLEEHNYNIYSHDMEDAEEMYDYGIDSTVVFDIASSLGFKIYVLGHIHMDSGYTEDDYIFNNTPMTKDEIEYLANVIYQTSSHDLWDAILLLEEDSHTPNS